MVNLVNLIVKSFVFELWIWFLFLIVVVENFLNFFFIDLFLKCEGSLVSDNVLDNIGDIV